MIGGAGTGAAAANLSLQWHGRPEDLRVTEFRNLHQLGFQRMIFNVTDERRKLQSIIVTAAFTAQIASHGFMSPPLQCV